MWASGAKIAHAPARAFFGNAGINLVHEQADERIDHFAADAREAHRQAVDFERHQHANPRLAHRPADAGGVREHEAALQQFELTRRDVLAGQQAEAGIDAVDGAVSAITSATTAAAASMAAWQAESRCSSTGSRRMRRRWAEASFPGFNAEFHGQGSNMGRIAGGCSRAHVLASS